MKSLRCVLVLMLFTAAPLAAQTGCFHSPEAPTNLLLLVGSVGVLGGAMLRRRK